MSVVYGKRGLSDMEFWKQMLRLEREVRNLLLHDFGIKDRIRERRRIKKFRVNEEMTPERAAECYGAWRGTVRRLRNNYYRVKRMDDLFCELYPGVEFRTRKELQKAQLRGKDTI